MPALWSATALLPDGWVKDVRITIDHGLVSAIDTGSPALPGDDPHHILLPGLANVHSHAFQRGMAGLATSRRQRRR